MANFNSKYTGQQVENILDKSSRLPSNRGNERDVLWVSPTGDFTYKPFPVYRHEISLVTNTFTFKFTILTETPEEYTIDSINEIPVKNFYSPQIVAGSNILYNAYVGIGIGVNNKALNIMYANTNTAPSTSHTFVSINTVFDTVNSI